MAKTAVKGSVSLDLVEELREVSKQRRVSISALIERALDAYLRELAARDQGKRRGKPARRR